MRFQASCSSRRLENESDPGVVLGAWGFLVVALATPTAVAAIVLSFFRPHAAGKAESEAEKEAEDYHQAYSEREPTNCVDQAQAYAKENDEFNRSESKSHCG